MFGLRETKVELRKPQKKAGSFGTVDSGNRMKQSRLLFFKNRRLVIATGKKGG